MRITALLLILGLAAAGAFATEPAAPAATPAEPAAAAPAATPAAAPAAAATVAAVPPETLKKALQVGLRPRQRKGTTMYCKDYAEIGTRFETEHCYPASELDTVIQKLAETQAMRRQAGACASAACGAR
jgi:pyruvate dehydrogenase E2 component (dihydrolipoamide acetyltransferase)